MKPGYVAVSAMVAGLFTPGATAQGIACNSYLWDLCFLVGRGDRVTTVMPADFAITEIEFVNGAHLTSYVGIGLADPEGSGGPTQLLAYELAGVSVRVYVGERTQRGRYFSLRYGTRGNQIFGWFNTAEQQRAVVDALATFHSCQRQQSNSASLECSSDRVFEEGARVIGALTVSPN